MITKLLTDMDAINPDFPNVQFSKCFVYSCKHNITLEPKDLKCLVCNFIPFITIIEYKKKTIMIEANLTISAE